MTHAVLDLPEYPERTACDAPPLQGLRVLDLSDQLAGAAAAMMLADLGADVVKVALPGEDEDSPNNSDSDSDSPAFLWANRNKRSVVLDAGRAEGAAALRALIAQADVLIETALPGPLEALGLGPQATLALQPRLLHCSITPYRRDGALAQRPGAEGVVQAESGFVSMNGFEHREGVRTGSPVMSLAAATMASCAVQAALLARQRSGRGQHIAVDVFGAALTLIGVSSIQHFITGRELSRHGNANANTAPTGIIKTPRMAFQISCSTTATFHRLYGQAAGRPDIAHDPELQERKGRVKRRDELFRVLTEAVGEGTWAEWGPKMKAAGCAVGEVRTVAQALRAEETRADRLVSRVPHARRGWVPNVGLPYELARTPGPVPRGAPLRGQHTQQVWADWVGTEVGTLLDAPTEVPIVRPPATQPWPHATAPLDFGLPAPAPRTAAAAPPLQGLRVLDFSHFVAGPLCTQMLGDLGADVIKIESPGKGDEYRLSGSSEPALNGEGPPFLWANRNKRSVVLDLKSPDGLALAHALVAQADVLLENFSAGVMRRFGLDHDQLVEKHPKLVVCSVSAYSRNGPFADRRGFDAVIQAECGFVSMNGYPDLDGNQTDSTVMDHATAMMACHAVLAALVARARDGVGQRVGTSLYATGLHMLGPAAMQHLLSGDDVPRHGNDDPDLAPDGLYRASDRAFFIACGQSPTAFRRLFAEVVGRPDIAAEPALQRAADRGAHRGRLAAVLAEAFAREPWAHWAPRLREAGVAAGLVHTLTEALRGDAVRDSGLVTQIAHPTAGAVPNIGMPLRFSDTPIAAPFAAPMLGQHTAEVMAEVLGLDAQRIAALAQAGAFGSKPLPGLAVTALA